MVNLVDRRGSNFVVDFGEIEIPSAIAKDLETEFQTMALRTLARLDYRNPFRFGRLPEGTWGIRFGGGGPIWPTPDPSGTPIPRIDDHTLIIDAAMRQGLALARAFSADRKAGREVAEDAILKLLMEIPSVDLRAKMSAAAVLGHLQASAGTAMSSRTDKRLHAIDAQIDACDSLDDLQAMLSELGRDRSLADIDGLSTSLEMAGEILSAGRSTIYSSDHPFYGGLTIGTDAGGTVIAKDNQDAKDVAKADVKGAIKGGVGGGAAGPEGVVVGVIIGSCVTSLKSVVSKIWDWL